jgi:hypothetical protein
MAAAVLCWASGVVLAQESTTPGWTPAQSVIPGQYIVVLEEARDPTAVAREHATAPRCSLLTSPP